MRSQLRDKCTGLEGQSTQNRWSRRDHQVLFSVTWPGSWGWGRGLGFRTRSLVLGEQLSGSVQPTGHPSARISRPQGLLDRDLFP